MDGAKKNDQGKNGGTKKNHTMQKYEVPQNPISKTANMLMRLLCFFSPLQPLHTRAHSTDRRTPTACGAPVDPSGQWCAGVWL